MMPDQQLIFGAHATRSALQSRPGQCVELLVRQKPSKSARQIEGLAQSHSIPVREIDPDEFERRVGDVNHQGVALLVASRAAYSEKDLNDLLDQAATAPLILVLDGVQDPHNLGACLRTAAGFGVDLVIVPKDRSCDLTPTVHKVAVGAVDRVPFVRVANLVRTLKQLKERGIWVFGADGESRSDLSSLELNGPAALVLGNEGKGLRRLTREACDSLFSIPMTDAVESFNVSVACGICLYESQRQRRSIK